MVSQKEVEIRVGISGGDDKMYAYLSLASHCSESIPTI